MASNFRGWQIVAGLLKDRANEKSSLFNEGQRATLHAIAARIEQNGVILADEVGMGKTRIAVAVAQATLAAGGRVALAIPPGLAFQWQDELKLLGVSGTPPVLRSVEGYLQVWDTDEGVPWFDEPIVMLSHRFANWKLGPSSKRSRYELLPLLYAHWYHRRNNRFPKNSHSMNGIRRDELANKAAKSIFENAYARGDTIGAETIDRIAEGVVNESVMQAENYNRHTRVRGYLEQAVGLGLGPFDLIVIDEAHKSRGRSSGLERLVENMLISSPNARRLAMTATPVELDVEQWEQILTRIGALDVQPARDAVRTYAEAVKKLRHVWRTDEEARKRFADAATEFQLRLSPYLLRRDKRQDAAVMRFVNASGYSYDTYRRESDINVSAKSLTPEWRQAICAAEALGFAAKANDGIAKRLRLTIGNGHAVSALLDQIWGQEEADRLQEKHEEELEKAENLDAGAPDLEVTTPDDKRASRVRWWQDVMATSFTQKDIAIYDHPAILAAIEEIEHYAVSGQKTLVFGRFTKPLQAITALLNARAMLRAISTGTPWPQAIIQENERVAVRAARQQLNIPFNLEEIDRILEAQYHDLERAREQFRDQVFDLIAEGLNGDQKVDRALLDDAVSANDPRVIDELIAVHAIAPRGFHLVALIRDVIRRRKDA